MDQTYINMGSREFLLSFIVLQSPTEILWSNIKEPFFVIHHLFSFHLSWHNVYNDYLVKMLLKYIYVQVVFNLECPNKEDKEVNFYNMVYQLSSVEQKQ